MGNLRSINYPRFTNSYAYDGRNRLTNMVDATGTNRFSWTDGDQLASEITPWPASTVSFTHTNRLRGVLSLQQPNGPAWTQSCGYDEFALLTNVTSPAGKFGYQYAAIYTSLGQVTSDLVSELDLPTGARISNSYDDLARLLSCGDYSRILHYEFSNHAAGARLCRLKRMSKPHTARTLASQHMVEL